MFVQKLTEARVRAIVAKGGPTFRIITGRRLRCNQDPELGRLTKAQAETIRSRCYPRNHAAGKPEPQGRNDPSPPAIPQARLFGIGGDARCPRCDVVNKGIGRPNKVRCRNCSRRFEAVR